MAEKIKFYKRLNIGVPTDNGLYFLKDSGENIFTINTVSGGEVSTFDAIPSTHVSSTISQTMIDNWNLAYNNSHTHSNKAVLDTITQTMIDNWNEAFINSHTHSNKANLDSINQNLSTVNEVQFAVVRANEFYEL